MDAYEYYYRGDGVRVCGIMAASSAAEVEQVILTECPEARRIDIRPAKGVWADKQGRITRQQTKRGGKR